MRKTGRSLLRLLGAGSTLYGVFELWASWSHWPHALGERVDSRFAAGCLFFLFGLWLLGSVRR